MKSTKKTSKARKNAKGNETDDVTISNGISNNSSGSNKNIKKSRDNGKKRNFDSVDMDSLVAQRSKLQNQISMLRGMKVKDSMNEKLPKRSDTHWDFVLKEVGWLSKDFGNERDLTIIATGSEVEIALETSDLLSKDNIKASVVSLPCWEIFEKQSEEYKLNVLGEKLKIGVEAGSELGWHKYIGSNGIFIGMKTFGASAPANHLFEHFGLSSDKIREKILGKINT